LRRKAIAIAVAVVVFAGTFIYLKFLDRFYETTTKFVSQSSPAQQNRSLSALASIAGISTGGSTDDGSAYMEDILKSRDFLSLFIDKEWLVVDTNRVADTLTPVTLEKFWKIKLDSAAKDRERVLQAIITGKMLKKKYIKYEQDKKTKIMTLTTQFEDPKLAYEFNIAVFEELNNMLLNKMHFKASENRKFIEERLKEVKSDLKRSEEILLNFMQQNRAWNDPSIKLQESRLMREVKINEELALQLQKQYEMAKIEEAKDMPLLDVIESPRRPLGPFKPQPKKILGIGLIGGIILGIIFALGLDLFITERKVLAEQISKAKKELE
jgi:uncharacterized protein involved in exopolysaccharide biosynthesis